MRDLRAILRRADELVRGEIRGDHSPADTDQMMRERRTSWICSCEAENALEADNCRECGLARVWVERRVRR